MESSRHKFYRFMMRIRSTRFYASNERFIWKTSSKLAGHYLKLRAQLPGLSISRGNAICQFIAVGLREEQSDEEQNKKRKVSGSPICNTCNSSSIIDVYTCAPITPIKGEVLQPLQIRKTTNRRLCFSDLIPAKSDLSLP